MIAAPANFIAALSTFRSGQIQVWIQITGYARSFTNYKSGLANQYDWITGTDDLATAIHDLDGGADQSVLTFHVLDKAGAITSDFPGFVFEGKLVTVKVGFAGLAQADFMTVFTGYVDTVASDNGNLEYIFNCNDISAKLSQPIYLNGDSGKPVDSSNPKTLNAHPLDLLLDILGVKVGLPGANYDTAKITAYRDGPFSGVQFNFRLTQSVVAADFIKEQLLKPLGGYLWVNSAGVITVNFFYPLAASVAVATLGPGTWMEIPGAQQVDMVNAIQWQFDKDDGASGASGDYLANDTELYQPSITKYGQYGELTIPADGLRSGLQGYFTARLSSRMIFLRYGLKGLKFEDDTADAIWQTCRVEPGDIVAVTHPNVPNREAGTVGVTNRLFEVLDRKFNFTEGLMTFVMIDANFLTTFGTYKITPNGKADFTLASAPDKLAYMFLCNDTDTYSDATAAHPLG